MFDTPSPSPSPSSTSDGFRHLLQKSILASSNNSTAETECYLVTVLWRRTCLASFQEGPNWLLQPSDQNINGGLLMFLTEQIQLAERNIPKTNKNIFLNIKYVGSDKTRKVKLTFSDYVCLLNVSCVPFHVDARSQR